QPVQRRHPAASRQARPPGHLAVSPGAVVAGPARAPQSRRPDHPVRSLDSAPHTARAGGASPMSRFRNRVDAQQAHIVSLRLAVGLLALLCLGLWYGWQAAPRDLTVHVPPDL